MDKYDVYEILYRGFVLVAISGGMLYFVTMLSGLCNGIIGTIIAIAMYLLWAVVTIGTASYVLIIMKGTFRPSEPEPDTIDDLIEELENGDVSELRIAEIILLIQADGKSQCDHERILYALDLLNKRVKELNGEEKHD